MELEEVLSFLVIAFVLTDLIFETTQLRAKIG